MPREFESYTERVERERNEEVRLRLGNQLNVDYKRANEVLRLEATTGLPRNAIEADFDNISERVRRHDFNPNEYKDTSPAWREFASEHPMELSVLQHDEDAMRRYERAYRELDSTTATERMISHGFDAVRWGTKPIRNAWNSSWAQNEMLEIGNAAALRPGGYTPQDEARLDELRKYQVSHNFGAEWSKPLVWLTKQSANMIVAGEQRLERGMQLGFTGAAIGGAYGAAGGTVILPGGGTAVGAGAGAAAGYSIGFIGGSMYGGYEAGEVLGRGEAYNEYRELGFNHQDAAWAAEISGNISATLEATLGQVMFTKLPGVRTMTRRGGDEVVKQLLGRESFRQIAGRAAFDYGAGVSGEIITEIGQESGLIVMGEILKGQVPGVAEALTGKEIASRIADVALETLKATFIIGGAGPGQRLLMDGRRARNAENFSTVLKELADGVQKTDMRHQLPEHWQQFVERVKDGGELESIGMPVQAFEEHWRANGVDPEVAAKELGIENYADAKITDGDVQIPILEFANKIAAKQETFNQMLPNLRPHEDAFTMREAEQYIADRDAVMSILEEGSAKIRQTEEDADIEQIVQDVTGQLVAAGHDEVSANQLGQIMRGIGIMAQREGLDPEPFFEQVFGGVKRTTEGAATRGEDIDAILDPLLNRLRNKDFPTQRDMFGSSLMDFIVEAGGIDVGDPELVAMDFDMGVTEVGVSKARVARWRKQGKDVSHITEAAAEAGYIPANEEALLIEALREELAGREIYGTRVAGKPGMQDLSATLDELSEIVDEAGIDLDEMSNAEVREALSKRTTLAQIDTKELQDLTSIVLRAVNLSDRLMAESGKEIYKDAADIDATMARAAAMLPTVDEAQDFGDLTISDRVQIQETGKRATRKVKVQTEFRRAVKRKNLVKRLLDCVSG